jgi:hypothetical protein
MRNYLSLLSIFSFATACTSSDDDGDAGTRVAGQAVYADSATDENGNPQDPAVAVGTADLSIVIEGSGTIPEIDPQCAIDPTGVFTASFLGEMTIAEDGAYVATLGSGSGSVTTPSGCEIPDLEVGVVTDVRVRAEIAATTQSCDGYCEASARASAEAECGASPSAAECRAAAAAEASASCTTTCTTETHVIVAEVSLAASLLGELDVETLRAAALGELHVDLVFDHMEDEQGNVIGQ